MSEMRRAARALVESRVESFESAYDLATSRERLSRALEQAGLRTGPTFRAEWREAQGRAILDAGFVPSQRTLWLLRGLSLAMVGFIALTVWILMRPGEGPERFLLPLFAVLTVLALPFVTLGLSSARAAQEARLTKAIRVALQDAPDAFAPRQKWVDED
jgi:hypothetical protein